MKTKLKLSGLFLAALMLFSLTACGKDSPEPSSTSEETEQTKPPVEAGSGTTIHTNLWDLTYDEADGWVYEEDDFYDNDDYVSISMSIPKEGTDTNLVIAEIYVSIEDPGDFRDYLTSYGFDEYEYAVNQAYEFTPVGGIDCLKAEGNYWGSPCLRYFGRVEGASATVLIQIIGEYGTAPGTGKESPSPPSPTAPWWVPTRSAASGSPSPTASSPRRPSITLLPSSVIRRSSWWTAR